MMTKRKIDEVKKIINNDEETKVYQEVGTGYAEYVIILEKADDELHRTKNGNQNKTNLNVIIKECLDYDALVRDLRANDVILHKTNIKLDIEDKEKLENALEGIENCLPTFKRFANVSFFGDKLIESDDESEEITSTQQVLNV